MVKLSINQLNKSYGNHAVLRNVNFDVEDKTMIAITGPSGCGKSTLLNIIGLIEKADSGSIMIDGKSILRINSSNAMKLRRNKIGYIFQNYALCQNETVYYNLKIALKYTKVKNRKEKIIEALTTVGLDFNQVLNQKVCMLSGGEQQRVAIARVLLKPCEIILADEPTGNLDVDNKTIVFGLFKQMQEMGKTVLLVTHDHELAKQCDQIVYL